MIGRHIIGITFNYHINFAHPQKLSEAMLVLQMPQLVESSEVVKSDDTFLVSFLVLF